VAQVSIVIPSRTEKFLNHTIKDVLSNATGDIEIFPVLDGYYLPKEEYIDDPRVKYIHIPNNGTMQKRHGINIGVMLAKGKFVMSLDAHCLVSKGFDEILARDCEPNMVMIPRRYKLDADNWCTKNHLDGSLPVDYEYWIYNDYLNGFLKPYRWDQRSIERKDIMIDDTLTMQASCWFMYKTWFNERGFMKIDGYTGWGQEDVEIAMETHVNGGRLVVNKNCYYAHLYKGKAHGRMYKPVVRQWDETKAYGIKHWTVDRREDFLKVIKKFMPIPRWPVEYGT